MGAGASGSVYQTRPGPVLVRLSGAGVWEMPARGTGCGTSSVLCHLRRRRRPRRQGGPAQGARVSSSKSHAGTATAPTSPTPAGWIQGHSSPAVCTHHTEGSRLSVYRIQATTAMVSDGG